MHVQIFFLINGKVQVYVLKIRDDLSRKDVSVLIRGYVWLPYGIELSLGVVV